MANRLSRICIESESRHVVRATGWIAFWLLASFAILAKGVPPEMLVVFGAAAVLSIVGVFSYRWILWYEEPRYEKSNVRQVFRGHILGFATFLAYSGLAVLGWLTTSEC